MCVNCDVEVIAPSDSLLSPDNSIKRISMQFEWSECPCMDDYQDNRTINNVSLYGEGKREPLMFYLQGLRMWCQYELGKNVSMQWIWNRHEPLLLCKKRLWLLIFSWPLSAPCINTKLKPYHLAMQHSGSLFPLPALSDKVIGKRVSIALHWYCRVLYPSIPTTVFTHQLLKWMNDTHGRRRGDWLEHGHWFLQFKDPIQFRNGTGNGGWCFA